MQNKSWKFQYERGYFCKLRKRHGQNTPTQSLSNGSELPHHALNSTSIPSLRVPHHQTYAPTPIPSDSSLTSNPSIREPVPRIYNSIPSILSSQRYESLLSLLESLGIYTVDWMSKTIDFVQFAWNVQGEWDEEMMLFQSCEGCKKDEEWLKTKVFGFNDIWSH